MWWATETMHYHARFFKQITKTTLHYSSVAFPFLDPPNMDNIMICETWYLIFSGTSHHNVIIDFLMIPVNILRKNAMPWFLGTWSCKPCSSGTKQNFDNQQQLLPMKNTQRQLETNTKKDKQQVFHLPAPTRIGFGRLFFLHVFPSIAWNCDSLMVWNKWPKHVLTMNCWFQGDIM